MTLYTVVALVSGERILLDSSEKNKSRLPMGTLHPGKQASLLAVFIIALRTTLQYICFIFYNYIDK